MGAPDEEEPGIPAYMVSFADMMTILLCFFILLCAFSETRQAGMVASGISSFRHAIKYMGMPGVLSRSPSAINLDDKKIVFRMPKIVPINPEDWREPNEREIINEFNHLQDQEMKTLPGVETLELHTDLRWAKGSARLPRNAKEKLQPLIDTLRNHPTLIEIEGHTDPSEGKGEEAYALSLNRALAVMHILRKETEIPIQRFRPVGWADKRPPKTNRSGARVVIRLIR